MSDFEVVIEVGDFADELIVEFGIYLVDRRLKKFVADSLLHVFLRLSDEDVPHFIENERHIAREDHQMLLTGTWVVDE